MPLSLRSQPTRTVSNYRNSIQHSLNLLLCLAAYQVLHRMSYASNLKCIFTIMVRLVVSIYEDDVASLRVDESPTPSPLQGKKERLNLQLIPDTMAKPVYAHISVSFGLIFIWARQFQLWLKLLFWTRTKIELKMNWKGFREGWKVRIVVGRSRELTCWSGLSDHNPLLDPVSGEFDLSADQLQAMAAATKEKN